MNSPRLLALAMAALLLPASASACVPATKLEGTLSIPYCDPNADADTCVPGGQAVFDALEALDIPGEFTVGAQTSPWRIYDGDDRIITIDEMAAVIRKQRTEKHHSVRLVGSWTAVLPEGDGATLAQRLSTSLDGFPVGGSDGFLWLSAKGAMRTTHQAFSVWKTGWYHVARGEDVMVALVPGAMAQFEDQFAADGNAKGVVRAGVGKDAFMLCPDGALAAFERAADMGSAIGAYNAGVMHAEAGDRANAIKWLEKASELGDAKAAERLAGLRAQPGGE